MIAIPSIKEKRGEYEADVLLWIETNDERGRTSVVMGMNWVDGNGCVVTVTVPLVVSELTAGFRSSTIHCVSMNEVVTALEG